MTFNVADRVQIDETISGQNVSDWRSYTNDKNVSYVVDQQNGAYSNQISWDMSSIVNQQSWMSLQESYILMPFSTTLAKGTAVLTGPSKFTQNRVSLKNNFINFVDSLQLFVNGEQLIDQTSFSNMAINVLDMLSMSQDDLKVEGSSLNIFPDTTNSIRYKKSAGVNGDGYSNNQFLTSANLTTLTNADYSSMNNGLAQRNLTTGGFYPQDTTMPPTITSSNVTNTLAPYFSEANDNSLAVESSWNYVICLPLARLSDLLSKYPLVKGSQIRLVLNFNAGTTTITTDTTATNANLKMTSYSASAGNTNPVLFSSNYINPITSTGTAGTLTLTTRIQTSAVPLTLATTAQKGYSALPNCRVYVPTYKINPTYEERILSNRVQKIRYYDWYQQPIINVSNGASFSQVLTTALPNVQALIMLPFQNGSYDTPSANQLYVNFRGSQFQSCFDTAPSTTLPNGMLAFQNFNVSVSGINIFNQNQNFAYDNWMQEVKKIGLNGGLSRELSSGLIDLTTWNWSPYVICDLSRRDENADKTYQSVVVSGQNNSGVAVDYYCFIAFEKEIEIDVLSGAVKRIF